MRCESIEKRERSMSEEEQLDLIEETLVYISEKNIQTVVQITENDKYERKPRSLLLMMENYIIRMEKLEM